MVGTIHEHLYDLEEDPLERTNLLADGRALCEFSLPEAFCKAVGGCRKRAWEAAVAVHGRNFTISGAETPAPGQRRFATCGEDASD